MHFEHRFAAQNEKNACIRPQRGYTCTYMVTALLFRDTFIMTDYIEKV